MKITFDLEDGTEPITLDPTEILLTSLSPTSCVLGMCVEQPDGSKATRKFIQFPAGLRAAPGHSNAVC